MMVYIVDYGMGNIGSIKRAISACGFDSKIASTAQDIMVADKIILPGVGSFNKAMTEIRSRGLEAAIIRSALEDKIPTLGICLGMQILATEGQEHGKTEGLNLIPGTVSHLQSQKKDIRVPHVGWNSVSYTLESPIFTNIPSNSDFYFVHSYYFKTQCEMHTIAQTQHGETFTCAVHKDNIYGTQFHPEKSQQYGLKLLKNFLEL